MNKPKTTLTPQQLSEIRERDKHSYMQAVGQSDRNHLINNGFKWVIALIGNYNLIHKDRKALLLHIEAITPKWTQITEDESTWPEEGTYLWAYGSVGTTLIHATYDVSMMRVIADMVERTYYRPLCSLDYPPQEDE